MPAKRNRQLMVDAARMYYVEGLDQGQIGRRLELSRSSVSRILATAREQGLVHVRIAGNEQTERNRELERDLARTFGLKEALVAGATSGAAEVGAVARLAGNVFTKRAPAAASIGIGWGFAIGKLVDALPATTLNPATRLIPLVGGMPKLDGHSSGTSHLQRLAAKCGLLGDRFDEPAVVESDTTWRALVSETWVQAALDRARRCDLAFVGIEGFGLHTSQLVLKAMKLDESAKAHVLAQRAAGGVIGRYFTVDGQPLAAPTSERVLGLTMDELAAIPLVVGIAAGQDRVEAALGALRTGAITILVVDEPLALGLLAQAATVRSTPGTRTGSRRAG